MASSSTPVHPARYLALFLVLLVGAYLLVFLTGDKKAEPKLGIDLQGGTRVTLTARTPNGSPPTRESLDQAKTIIENRVNGLGVSGSEVIIDGSNLVITVPGDEGSEARNLGQTARLYIRPVIHAMPAARRSSSRPPKVLRAHHPGPRRVHRRGPAGRARHASDRSAGAGRAGSPARKRRTATRARPHRLRRRSRAPIRPSPRPSPHRRRHRHRRGRTRRRGRSRHRLREHRHLRPARRARRPPARPRLRSASPTRRNCARAPISRSRSLRCSSRRPVAVRTMCWPATTTRTCH